MKSNIDSTIKGTMMRSSSCNNIVVNGQEIIKGAFVPKTGKRQIIDLCLSRNAKLIQNNNNNNNSLFILEKQNKQKIESLDYTMKNQEQLLPKIIILRNKKIK